MEPIEPLRAASAPAVGPETRSPPGSPGDWLTRRGRWPPGEAVGESTREVGPRWRSPLFVGPRSGHPTKITAGCYKSRISPRESHARVARSNSTGSRIWHSATPMPLTSEPGLPLGAGAVLTDQGLRTAPLVAYLERCLNSRAGQIEAAGRTGLARPLAGTERRLFSRRGRDQRGGGTWRWQHRGHRPSCGGHRRFSVGAADGPNRG